MAYSWYVRVTYTRNTYGHAFTCRCGQKAFFINENSRYDKYRCPYCWQDVFIDITSQANNLSIPRSIQINRRINGSYDLAYLHAGAPLPVSFDHKNKRIVFQNVLIWGVRIALKGGIIKPYEQDNIQICRTLKNDFQNQLYEYIAPAYLDHVVTNFIKTPHLPQETFCDKVRFFLHYFRLRHSDFYRWHMDEDLYHTLLRKTSVDEAIRYLLDRNEKSVKRTLFRRYRRQIIRHRFDPLSVYALARTFSDPNVLCKLLERHDLDLRPRPLTTQPSRFYRDAKRVMDFLHWLIRRYGQKRTASVLQNDFNVHLWKDAISIYEQLPPDFLADPLKSKATLSHIHDELALRMHIASNKPNRPFAYSHFVKQAQGVWENVELILPPDTHTLYRWGALLNNCLASYDRHISAYHSVVFGVKKNGTLRYAIELVPPMHDIVQFYGPGNTMPPKSMQETIRRWHRRYFSL